MYCLLVLKASIIAKHESKASEIDLNSLVFEGAERIYHLTS